MSATAHTQSCCNHARFLTRSFIFKGCLIRYSGCELRLTLAQLYLFVNQMQFFPVHCLKWIAIRRSKCLIKTRQTGCLNTLTFFNHKWILRLRHSIKHVSFIDPKYATKCSKRNSIFFSLPCERERG